MTAVLKTLKDKSWPVPLVSGVILQVLDMTEQRTSERCVCFMQGNFSHGAYRALQHTILWDRLQLWTCALFTSRL